jgi:predicted nucleic acid-binding protein
LIPAGLFLVDTSVAARSRHELVRTQLVRLGRLGLLARCATVDLEVLYSARSPQEYLSIDGRRREGLTDLPMLPEIGDRARAVQREMARTSQHRSAGVIDLLTAATAEHYGAIVLHYDSDFDHIARATKQPTRWIVEPGLLD